LKNLTKSQRFIAILFLGGLVFVLFYLPSLIKYYDLKVREERLDRKIQELETKEGQLAEEEKLLEGDPEYLEKIAREELGFAKPGEVVYKLVPEKAPSMASQAVPVDKAKAASGQLST
jgi:cell division protein FtsB